MITQATAIKPATSTQERSLITIEFTPNIHKDETEYTYEHPQFVFGDSVALKQFNLTKQTNEFTVCGLELVQSKTPSGQLLNQPYWKYLLDNGQETIWRNESALIRQQDTCSQCPHFNDFDDTVGRGWCNLFGQQARKHHQRTNDCDLFADTDPIDAPHARFAIDSNVKVIDSDEHHTEWASFVVIGRKYNAERYRSTEAYLTEPNWYYELVGSNYQPSYQSVWIAENDICEANQSHLIRTADIF